MSKQIKNPILRDWFARALEHGQQRDSWTEIKPGSEQWHAWEHYFIRLGVTPITFKQLGKFSLIPSWTAPCEWPSELAGRL